MRFRRWVAYLAPLFLPALPYAQASARCAQGRCASSSDSPRVARPTSRHACWPTSSSSLGVPVIVENKSARADASPPGRSMPRPMAPRSYRAGRRACPCATRLQDAQHDPAKDFAPVAQVARTTVPAGPITGEDGRVHRVVEGQLTQAISAHHAREPAALFGLMIGKVGVEMTHTPTKAARLWPTT